MRSSILAVVMLSAGAAYANPGTPVVATLPQPPFLTLQPMPMFDPVPAPTEPSVRIDAARVAAEVFENSWRYPDPEPVFALAGNQWFIGDYRYTPGSRRAAALHGSSMAATLIGGILLEADSPLAGVGALLTGVTLDAAAADADRAAEVRRRR